RSERRMNLFQRHGVRDYTAATAQIPVIDFGPVFAGEAGALGSIVAGVRDACEHVGFFYAANHGVPEPLVDRAFAASRAFHALGAMCARMLPVFAVALDLDPGFFAPFFADEAHANLRFLHYPPQNPDEDNTFGQAPHTDNSFMTALARTDGPGLAVRLPSGEWFAPPVIPGTFLINLGNIMKRWSNDRFLSTPHGVLNESGTDRYSIAFFYSPNVEAIIECLPTCADATSPARYPRAVYGDLVLEFYNANYFHRKDYAGAENASERAASASERAETAAGS